MKYTSLIWLHVLGIAWWLLPLMQVQAQGLASTSLPALWTYADAHSAVVNSGKAQTELARLQSAAAIANTVNLRGTASFSMTNNFSLPVNFLPAEIFGGPAGTFRAITFGQQFVNVASIAPQLDVINPSTWARVGSATASKQLTEVTNDLNRRVLHENIATAYYNFRSAESQREFAVQNLAMADTIAAIVGRRYAEGIARQQDLNNALVNRANLADFVQQLDFKIAQATLTLKALIGMPQQESFPSHNIDTRPIPTPAPHLAASQLQSQQAMLQAKLQRSELLANRMAFLPTVSVVAGFNWQQNSNESSFNSADWIQSQYIGLKLSVPLPTETRLWSQAEEYRIQLKIKEINAAQMVLQEATQNQQLDLDIQRATQALVTAESVANLKFENFESSKRNYDEGIISLDQYLTAFTDLLNARLTQYNAKWNLQLQLTRLELNGLE